VRLWDLTSERKQTILGGHSEAVSAVAFSPTEGVLASSSADQTVRLWNIETGQSRGLAGHTAAVTCIAFRPDGAILASGSKDGTIRLWKVATTTTLTTITACPDDKSWVSSIAFSPDGRILAASTRGDNVAGARPIWLWDVENLLAQNVSAISPGPQLPVAPTDSIKGDHRAP
jgi:WD40 repeat protein